MTLRRFRSLPLLGACVVLAACGTPQSPSSSSSATTAAAPTQPASAPAADLGGVKSYLTTTATSLQGEATRLQTASQRYYELAKAANFDYAALLGQHRAEAAQALGDAKAAWLKASPLYEQMEGIVAGTPSLAQYDVILDAGTSAAEGGEDVVPFDLALPDGRTVAKPGNLFGVTESALWGTEPSFQAANVKADLDGNGTVDFGEALPDANLLQAAATTLATNTAALLKSANDWQPTEAEAFGALIGNVPTIGDFFEAWKQSRFVAGDAAKQRDFVAISRLSDMTGNVASWQVIYQGVSPLVQKVDPDQDRQIQQKLTDLKTYITDLYTKEQGGKQFSPEEADLLSAEAQNRATAITGQISQVAAKLNVTVKQ